MLVAQCSVFRGCWSVMGNVLPSYFLPCLTVLQPSPARPHHLLSSGHLYVMSSCAARSRLPLVGIL